MKHIVKFLFSFLFLFVLFYLLMSFHQLSFNTSEWKEVARFLNIMFPFLFSAGYMALTKLSDLEDEE